MYKYCLFSTINNCGNILLVDFHFAIENHLVTFNGHNLTRIFVNKIFNPALKNPGCDFTAYALLQISLVDLYILCKIEYVEYVFVGFKADCTQERCYRQLFLTVDVGIHHIVYVRGKLNPRTLERNYTCRIKLCAICMYARTEEYARRAVKL